MRAIWDLFFDLWSDVASLGWSGYTSEGRGVVSVEIGEDCIRLGYRAGGPCDCHAREVQGYDPRSEVVVVLFGEENGPEEHTVRVLAGWPPPAEAVTSTGPTGPRLAAH